MAPCVQNATGDDARGSAGQDWTEPEVEAASFADARLHRRFAGLLRQLAAGVGSSIPQACGDWAGAKAAYRFLANARVDEADILGGHFTATRDRFRACPGVVLHRMLADRRGALRRRARRRGGPRTGEE